jgi:hypothetical protein
MGGGKEGLGGGERIKFIHFLRRAGLPHLDLRGAAGVNLPVSLKYHSLLIRQLIHIPVLIVSHFQWVDPRSEGAYPVYLPLLALGLVSKP